jgi:hypothetical protein
MCLLVTRHMSSFAHKSMYHASGPFPFSVQQASARVGWCLAFESSSFLWLAKVCGLQRSGGCAPIIGVNMVVAPGIFVAWN